MHMVSLTPEVYLSVYINQPMCFLSSFVTISWYFYFISLIVFQKFNHVFIKHMPLHRIPEK